MEHSILVIDDNRDLRENTAEILELAGYKVMTAENGKSGVEMALKQKPSVIVCDIMMPELDGYGVLHLVKKNPDTQNIPFIFLTAKTERSDFRKGMEMGADDYITKPFDEIELLNAIEVRLKKASILEQQYPSTPQGLSKFIGDIQGAGLIDKLSEQYNIETYSKKQVLFQEGKRPRYLYYLLKGKVKCFRSHEDGKEYITDLFSDGNFVGHAALIEDSCYTENARIIEESEIIQIPKEDFLRMVFTDVSIATKFIHIITQNVKEKEERLLSLAYSSLRKRVAKALIDITSKFHIDGLDASIEISREEIAQYVGTATESLIRTLSDFKAEHLIDIKSGKIRITDPDKLKNFIY